MALTYLSGNRIQGLNSDRYVSALSLTTGTTETAMTASTIRGFGNRIGASHSLIGKKVTKVTIDFKTAMTGTITVGIWDSAEVLQLTLGTFDASLLTAGFVAYTFENTTGKTIATNDIIGWKVSGANTTGVIARRTSTSADSNIEGTYINDSGNWADAGIGDPNQDYNMIVYNMVESNWQDGARFEETDTETIHHFITEPNGLNDDFSSDNWIDVGTKNVVTGGSLSFDFKSDGTTHQTYYDLGYTADENNWILRWKHVTSNISNPSAGFVFGFIGLSSNTSASNVAQDNILAFLWSDATPKYAIIQGEIAPDSESQTDLATSMAVGTVYLELKRTSSTTVVLSIYSDSTYTTLTESKLITIASTVNNLRYIKVMTTNQTSATGGSYDGTIDDMKFYNGVSNIPNWWTKQ